MKRLLVLIGVGLVSCSPTEEQIYQKVLPSVVKVEGKYEVEPMFFFFFSQKKGKKIIVDGGGTAFAVNGRLLTCHHVIKDAVKLEIMDSKGQRQVAQVLWSDKDTDLAELWVKNMPPSLKLARSPPHWQDKVYQVGNPSGLHFLMTSGRFSHYDGANVYNITSYFGSSGSPMMNVRGEVVGMCHAIIGGASTITFGGTLGDLKSFLVYSNDGR